MVKKLKKPPQRGIPLPIKPTEHPKPQDVMLVAHAVLEIVQRSILNPAAVISVLKAAEDVYVSNARDKGMPDDVIENSQVLGITLSQVMQKMFDGQEEPSPILTRDTGLVGPDGQPLAQPPRPMTPAESDSEAALAAYRESTEGEDATESGEEEEAVSDDG